MESATRGSLEAVGDLRDGDARRMTDEDMDMVGRVADSHELAVERAGFSFEQSGEPSVEARLEPWHALTRRPDEVDHEDGRGVGMPRDERNERIHRCPVGHIRRGVARGWK